MPAARRCAPDTPHSFVSQAEEDDMDAVVELVLRSGGVAGGGAAHAFAHADAHADAHAQAEAEPPAAAVERARHTAAARQTVRHPAPAVGRARHTGAAQQTSKQMAAVGRALGEATRLPTAVGSRGSGGGEGAPEEASAERVFSLPACSVLLKAHSSKIRSPPACW